MYLQPVTIARSASYALIALATSDVVGIRPAARQARARILLPLDFDAESFNCELEAELFYESLWNRKYRRTKWTAVIIWAATFILTSILSPLAVKQYESWRTAGESQDWLAVCVPRDREHGTPGGILVIKNKDDALPIRTIMVNRLPDRSLLKLSGLCAGQPLDLVEAGRVIRLEFKIELSTGIDEARLKQAADQLYIELTGPGQTAGDPEKVDLYELLFGEVRPATSPPAAPP